jgi:hypothetical protein
VLVAQEIAKESRLRKGQTDFRSDRDVKMVGSSLAGRVSTRRYKIWGTLGADSLRARDLVRGHAAALPTTKKGGRLRAAPVCVSMAGAQS